MTNVIKHALKYQEYRRTLFLNLMGKDDFGRHRGQVLYGMELTPVGTSVRIRPGAFVTPYGTRFYWDVVNADDPSINTIDLATLQIDGQGIFDTYNDIRRPIMVAIVARATPEEPARQPGVEAETDMGANSIEFAAFVVAHSRATGQPTLHLPPLNPVEMDEEQTGLQTNYDYIKTWDVPSVNSTVALLAGNPATESLGVNDVLLGYVTIGCSAAGTPVRTLQSGGTWAEGVAYTPVRNAWQSLMDFLGFDPLMGRVSMPITGPVIGSASPAAEGTLVKFQAGAGAGLGTTTYLSPKFGTPAVFSDAAPWIGDWKDYRPPSFLKDGEQLIWQLRRLDTFLRLWMDRTGDQTLIQLIQDGGHADTSWQTPLHRILQVFTGLNGVGTPNKNLNALAWPDGAPGVSQPVDNHVLKSGVAGHLDRGLAVLATEFGDSHAAAIAALDWAVWHLLQDVVGFGLSGRPGIDRSGLRSTGTWTRSEIPGLAHTADAPHAGRPVLVTGAATAYLDTEPALTAVTEVAKRTSSAGTNLLRNPCFQAGDGNSQVDGEIPFWTRDGASAWSRGDLIAALQVKQLSLTLDGGNRQVYQRLDDANLAAVLTAGEPLSVAATLKVTSGSIELILVGQTSGGATTVFEAKSQPLTTMAAFETHNFSFKPVSVTGVARLELIIRSSNGANAAVVLAGLWAGPGQPPLNPALQSSFHDFVSKDGGVIGALRGDLDLGTHKLLRVADGVLATDGINKGQLTTAIGDEVTARNLAIAAEALARSNADSGLQNQINTKAPIDSPALTGTPTAPTPTTGDSSTRIATTAFVAASVRAPVFTGYEPVTPANMPVNDVTPWIPTPGNYDTSAERILYLYRLLDPAGVSAIEWESLSADLTDPVAANCGDTPTTQRVAYNGPTGVLFDPDPQYTQYYLNGAAEVVPGVLRLPCTVYSVGYVDGANYGPNPTVLHNIPMDDQYVGIAVYVKSGGPNGMGSGLNVKVIRLADTTIKFGNAAAFTAPVAVYRLTLAFWLNGPFTDARFFEMGAAGRYLPNAAKKARSTSRILPEAYRDRLLYCWGLLNT